MPDVQLAYPHGKTVAHSWHESLARLRRWDRDHDQRLAEDVINVRTHPIRLVQSRNLTAKMFLDSTEHEWLWLVDTDMGFEPDCLDRLLQAADPGTAPVVGALCFAPYETAYDGMGGMRVRITPTMYMIGHDLDGNVTYCFYGPYPEDTVVQVAGTGAACLLVHRTVLEKVRAEHGDVWFDQLRDSKGDVVGEDLSFCLRVGSVGIPVFVHTGVKTSHLKDLYVLEEDYLRQPLQRMDDAPDIPVEIHTAASLATLVSNDHVHADGMLKLDADLDRYRSIIEATKPEVIVETGTNTGASAHWFAELGVDVITVDVNHPSGDPDVTASGERIDGGGWVAYEVGDSADPAVAARVAELVAGRRCMVSLDSDHSAGHVAKEIDLYGPLVTAGCYLVVEDGIFGYAPDAIRKMHFPDGLDGSPLDAVAEKLDGNPDWSRDLAIERMSPTSHHPAGWWRRNE